MQGTSAVHSVRASVSYLLSLRPAVALPFSLELGIVFAYVLCVATPSVSGGSVGSTDLLISVEASEEDEAAPADMHHDDDAAGVELTSISKR